MQVIHALNRLHSIRMFSNPVSLVINEPWTTLLYRGINFLILLLGAVTLLSLISSGVGNSIRILRDSSMQSSGASGILAKASTSENKKAFELVLLDVGYEARLIPGTVHLFFNCSSYLLLQFFTGGYVLLAKPVEVHQRSNAVEIPDQLRHVRGKPLYRYIATEGDGCWLHIPIPKMIREDIIDKLFFGSPLHRDREPDHGRPPSKFFCQRAPVVKLSSNHI